MTPAQLLADGVAQLGLASTLGAQQQARLLDYLQLLRRWNRTYNLTALRDDGDMVGAHLLDALAVLPHLGTLASLADVGSGGGLPGIPLALARPDLQVTLIESTQKKASFLTQVKIDLNLPNVSVHCGRVEDLAIRPEWKAVDVAISRAFADLSLFVQLAGALIAPGGRLLAMKGMDPRAEIAALPATWVVRRCLPLQVPGLAAQRHLLIIEKA